jgi:nucleoside-diphosphate-sugar epimerase
MNDGRSDALAGGVQPVKTVAVTGADGFLGTHLCALLEAQGRRVIRIVRRASGLCGERRVVDDLLDHRALEAALSSAEVVVHLAARAHVLRETESDPEAAFRRTNVEGMRCLCTSAARAGLRRIVFVSSIGVNGVKTEGRPFTESDMPAPTELYAVSKWAAECLLRERCKETGLESVVVRPPLVYGPWVKGNFLKLLHLASRRIPLPLGHIRNRRSFIQVGNLCDLLALCIDSSTAAGQTYLAADPTVHSTAELVSEIRRSLGRRALLVPVSEPFIRVVARIVGRRSQFERLCGSLEVCADKARAELGWTSRVGFEQGVTETVAWFREQYLARG